MSHVWSNPLSPFLSWFFYRSGVPVVIYLIVLDLGTTSHEAFVWGMAPGLAVMALSQSFCAIQRPFRLLLSSAAAMVLASLSAWICDAMAVNRFLVVSLDDRLARIRELQTVLEATFSLEVVVSLLLLWLVLVLTGRLASQSLETPGPGGRNRVALSRWFKLLGASLMAANLYVLLQPDYARPTPPQLFARRAPSGTIRLLEDSQLRYLQSYPGFRSAGVRCLRWTDFHGLTGQERFLLFNLVARRLEEPEYELTVQDLSLLYGMTGLLSSSGSARAEEAEWAMSWLCHDRRRQREFSLPGVLRAFRLSTLPWLAAAPLDARDLELWEARAAQLELSSDSVILSRRAPQIRDLNSEPPMQLLGFPFRPLAATYLDLETRWRDLSEGAVQDESALRRLQPEMNAVRAILAIKRERLQTGNYPTAVETPLGTYAKAHGGAQLVLHPVGTLRPSVLLLFP